MHLYNCITENMEKEKEQEKNSKWKYVRIFVGVALFVIVLWITNCLLLVDNTDPETNNSLGDRGTFGDMFGAVNALFSGLAFAGLIVTLIMQHDELRLQREEINNTNKELAGQKKEFEEQNKNLQIQRFENTLFNMLSTQQHIVDGLSTNISKKGIEVFEYFYKNVCIDVNYTTNVYGGIRDYIRRYDYNFYHKVEDISILNSYFRHLYRIFKYIDESPLINDSERYDYTCIIRAQLSDYELLMLFYNALVNKDNSEFKFKRLIEKYALFNNLKRNELARTENDEDYKLYKESAYKYQANEDVSNKKS